MSHSSIDPAMRHRRSIRLPKYDYSQAGAYFVTITTFQRKCLFGRIMDGQTRLSNFGRIAEECWQSLPKHFSVVEIGIHVVMPNHVHGILSIRDTDEHRTAMESSPSVGARHASPLRVQPRGVSPRSLGAIVGSFKSAVTRHINTMRNTAGTAVWQRNSYEHIVQDDQDWQKIHDYILNNPLNWESDEEFLAAR